MDIETIKGFSPLVPKDVYFLQELSKKFDVSATPSGKTLKVSTCAPDEKTAEDTFENIRNYLRVEKMLPKKGKGKGISFLLEKCREFFITPNYK
jgi:hypothetical protein